MKNMPSTTPTITTRTRPRLDDITGAGWFWIAYGAVIVASIAVLLLDVLVWRP